MGRKIEGDSSNEIEIVEMLDQITVKSIQCWNLSACIDDNHKLYIWGTLQGTKKGFAFDEPIEIEGLTVASVGVSNSALAVIDNDTQVLHMVDCNTETAIGSEDFEFNLVSEIDNKRIELIALGKSGFSVAIGPLQDSLAKTTTIRL